MLPAFKHLSLVGNCHIISWEVFQEVNNLFEDNSAQTVMDSIIYLFDWKESPSFDASFDLCLANILAFRMALFFSLELIDEELIAAISATTTSAAL